MTSNQCELGAGFLECGDLSPLSALGLAPESGRSELQRLAAKAAGGTKSGNELPQSKKGR